MPLDLFYVNTKSSFSQKSVSFKFHGPFQPWLSGMHVFASEQSVIPSHFRCVLACSSTLAPWMPLGRLWSLITCLDSCFILLQLKEFYRPHRPPLTFLPFQKFSLDSAKTNCGSICKGCIILRGKPRRPTASAVPRRLSLVSRPRTMTASRSSAACV